MVCVSGKVRFSNKDMIRNRASVCVRTSLGLQQGLGIGLGLDYM